MAKKKGRPRHPTVEIQNRYGISTNSLENKGHPHEFPVRVRTPLRMNGERHISVLYGSVVAFRLVESHR